MMRMIRSKHLLPIICLAVVALFALSTPGERVVDEESPVGSARHALKFDEHADAGSRASEWVAAEGDTWVRDAKPTTPAAAPISRDDEEARPPSPGANVNEATLIALHGHEPLTRDHPHVAAAIEIQERHSDRLMAHEAVVGHGIGINDDGHIALVIFTKAEAPDLPDVIERLPVIVQQSGEFFALNLLATQDASPRKHPGGSHKGNNGGGGNGGGDDEEPAPDPTARQNRPVPIGVSTGHPDITAGTIGCRVTDANDVYALSANHIYAVENDAMITDPVIQPGDFDGGTSPADDIGTLFDFEPIVFSPTADNVMDAAIALSSTADLGNATLSDGYGTPKSATIAAAINAKVKKYGRTSGQTKGRIVAINVTAFIGYSSGTARFIGQIVSDPPPASAGGDSGALIVIDGKEKNKDDDRKPVSLLFAGSAFNTISSPIDPILVEFGVTVDGEQ